MQVTAVTRDCKSRQSIIAPLARGVYALAFFARRLVASPGGVRQSPPGGNDPKWSGSWGGGGIVVNEQSHSIDMKAAGSRRQVATAPTGSRSKDNVGPVGEQTRLSSLRRNPRNRREHQPHRLTSSSSSSFPTGAAPKAPEGCFRVQTGREWQRTDGEGCEKERVRERGRASSDEAQAPKIGSIGYGFHDTNAKPL